jgi:hypothetical protein
MSRERGNAPTLPRLPSPAGGIDDIYVNQLIAALEDTIEILNSVRHRTFSEINLTSLQGHGGNLRVGDVYEDSGILKIVRTGDVLAASQSMTMSIGTVTVSTP